MLRQAHGLRRAMEIVVFLGHYVLGSPFCFAGRLRRSTLAGAVPENLGLNGAALCSFPDTAARRLEKAERGVSQRFVGGFSDNQERRPTCFGLLNVRSLRARAITGGENAALFWYLPFMIMSGAYDTFYRSDPRDDGGANASRAVEQRRALARPGRRGPRSR